MMGGTSRATENVGGGTNGLLVFPSATMGAQTGVRARAYVFCAYVYVVWRRQKLMYSYNDTHEERLTDQPTATTVANELIVHDCQAV